MHFVRRPRAAIRLALAVVSTLAASSPSPAAAQAAPSVTRCQAERTRAVRAGRSASELDIDARFAPTADRAYALGTVERARLFSADVTKSESERAYWAYNLCVYEGRLAQLGGPPRPSITLVTNFGASAPQGSIARAFVSAWGDGRATWARATPTLTGITDLEAGPADGSRLLLVTLPQPTAADARQTLAALSSRVQQIAMVAGPAASSPTNAGIALFAPLRTPPAQVAELTEHVRAAMAVPSFSAALASENLPPATGTVTSILAALASLLPGAPPAPAPARLGGRFDEWPIGTSPGNLYIFERCSQWVPGFCDPVMVAGQSIDEALAAGKRGEASSSSSPDPLNSRWTLRGECRGAAWGAAIRNVDDNGQKTIWGAACASSPGQALLEAGRQCAMRGPCSHPGPRAPAQFRVLIAHSGALTKDVPCSEAVCAPLWAKAGNITSYRQPVLSAADAVAKLGKVCSDAETAPYPCFQTSRNIECWLNMPTGQIDQCVDYKYTAEGVEDYRAGERQPRAPGR